VRYHTSKIIHQLTHKNSPKLGRNEFALADFSKRALENLFRSASVIGAGAFSVRLAVLVVLNPPSTHEHRFTLHFSEGFGVAPMPAGWIQRL
jgi:hypothetical protein